MEVTKLSHTAVYYHVHALVREGLIDRTDMRGLYARKPRAAKPAVTAKKPKKQGPTENELIAARIEQIVARAKALEADQAVGVDVVYDFRHSLGHKATRLG